MRWRLSSQAERDVASILRHTRDRFGPDQATRYAALIVRTFALAAEQPDRPNSHARPELGASTRSLHVAVASARRGPASHVVYYMLPATEDDILMILRVLHEHMEPRRRVRMAISDLTRS
jgi:toxin ParE1/3/4